MRGLYAEVLGELEIHTELLVISGCGEVLAAPLTAPSPIPLDFIGMCEYSWPDI